VRGCARRRAPRDHARERRAALRDPRRRVGSRRTLLERVAGLRPDVDAAVECDGAAVAHGTEGCRRKGGDLAVLTVGEDPHRRVGQLLVDAELELAPGDVARAWQVARLEGVALADVE